MLPPRTRASRWIAAVTTVIAVASVGVFVASPAHAEVFANTVDSFDNVPDDRWDIDSISGQSAVTMGRDSFARTAPGAARLDARTWTNAVAKITRTITPDPNTGGFRMCGISVYIRRLGVPGEPRPTVQVSMRIRASGPTGPIRSAQGVTVGTTLNFEHWAFSQNFPYPTSQLTLEIAAFRGVAVIDDLRITCGTV